MIFSDNVAGVDRRDRSSFSDLAKQFVAAHYPKQGNTQAYAHTHTLSLSLPLELTKHSAASSMKPSWKRCSSLKVSAKAWRRLSEGRALSRLCWNWEKIPWRGKKNPVYASTLGHHIHGNKMTVELHVFKHISDCILPLMHKRCMTLPDRSVQVASSSCVWRCPAAKVPAQRQAVLCT